MSFKFNKDDYFKDPTDTLSLYVEKFGATFAIVLYEKSDKKGRAEIDRKMEEALAGKIKPITDKDLIGDTGNDIDY